MSILLKRKIKTNVISTKNNPPIISTFFNTRRYGVEFRGLCNGRADLLVDGVVKEYLVHHVLTFDPLRRRMSVIVEDEEGT